MVQQVVYGVLENESVNKYVLTSLREFRTVGAVLADRGSEFHSQAAATGNTRPSSVERRMAATVSASDDVDRRRRLLTSATCK